MTERGKSYVGTQPSPPGTGPPEGERRVALVIGNANYAHGAPLRNPHLDAEAIAGLLARLGFELTVSPAHPDQHWHADLDLISMKRMIADFGIAAERADMAVVYFAGHGLEVDGNNYLLPIDAELEHVRRVRAETASLSELLDEIDSVSRLPLVILDACRDNPFVGRMRGLEGARSFRSGLAEIEPSGDVLVAYAARQGLKAQDGPEGGNSPYAKALVEHLATPDVDLRILLGRVRDAVRNQTNHKQHPHFSGSLGGEEIYLAKGESERSPALPDETTLFSLAAEEWVTLKDSKNIARLGRFAQHFAGTYYAELADECVRELHDGQALNAKDSPPASLPRAKIERLTELRSKLEAAKRKAAQSVTEHVKASLKDTAAQAKIMAEQAVAEGRIHITASNIHGVPEVGDGGWFKPGAGQTEWFKDLDVGPEMIVVPAGKFMMGSPQDEPESSGFERPQHEVTIATSFAVSRYAITFDEWDAYISDTDGDIYSAEDVDWGRGTRPVINVLWDEALGYIVWLSRKTGQTYRFLSEAEWEYAARAGTATPFWWGKSIMPEQANYDGNVTYACGGSEGKYREETVPVETFDANPWGLCNVHGNVWELCEDVWHDSYNGAPTDGSAWLTAGDKDDRVVRGGAWDTDPGYLRAASRSYCVAGFGNDDSDTGFRLARTLNP